MGVDFRPWQEAPESRTGEAWGQGGCCVFHLQPSLEEPALSVPQTRTLTSGACLWGAMVPG